MLDHRLQIPIHGIGKILCRLFDRVQLLFDLGSV